MSVLKYKTYRLTAQGEATQSVSSSMPSESPLTSSLTSSTFIHIYECNSIPVRNGMLHTGNK